MNRVGRVKTYQTSPPSQLFCRTNKLHRGSALQQDNSIITFLLKSLLRKKHLYALRGLVPFVQFNLLSANPRKWSNTIKQLTNCFQIVLSVCSRFVGLALKGLKNVKNTPGGVFRLIKLQAHF